MDRETREAARAGAEMGLEIAAPMIAEQNLMRMMAAVASGLLTVTYIDENTLHFVGMAAAAERDPAAFARTVGTIARALLDEAAK